MTSLVFPDINVWLALSSSIHVRHARAKKWFDSLGDDEESRPGLLFSTMTALKLFDADSKYFLPRVFCYFDDTIGGDVEFFNDFTGERLAIHEFNESHRSVKLSPVYYLSAAPSSPSWHHQIWSLHYFDHPKYNTFVSGENQQLAI